MYSLLLKVHSRLEIDVFFYVTLFGYKKHMVVCERVQF